MKLGFKTYLYNVLALGYWINSLLSLSLSSLMYNMGTATLPVCGVIVRIESTWLVYPSVWYQLMLHMYDQL